MATDKLAPRLPPGQVRFSPYKPTLIACSAAQYYGIVGNGRLYVLDVDPSSSVVTPVAM
jgi:hypothetical protein